MLPVSKVRCLPRFTGFAFVSGLLLFVIGCGSGPSGNTHTTLLITSTNDAKIPIFRFNLQDVTLIAKDGKSTPVLTTPQVVELGSINGVARPLVTLDIPRGTYSSVKLTYGSSIFAVIDRSGGAGSIDISAYNINTPQNQPVTVEQTLSTPLVVADLAMGLLLDINIPQSTTYTPYFAGTPNLTPDGGQTTFKPVFSLSGITPAARPSTLQDGKVEDVHGLVTASTGGALTITSDNGTILNFTTSSSTTFAGADGSTASPIGSFVDIDAALQADGSMLATHVQTEAIAQKYDMIGQVIQYTLQRYISNMGRAQQGPDLPNGTGFLGDNVEFSPTALFDIAWPNGTMPTGLPFTPTLSPAAIVPGQNLATPLDALQVSNVIPLTSFVTLEPQTIDGTVTGTSTVNGQTSYTVNLFADDFIPLFGPSSTVVIYATAETHTITTSALASGSVGRFRGLLFNDAGTLRMVATEIEDGVPGS